jgi:hypothetical protein
MASGAGGMAQTATKSASMGWLPWALGAAALLGLGWYFLGGATVPKVALPSAAPISTAATEAAGRATSVLNDLRATLGTIKDADSAKAALPKLQGAVGDLDKLSAMAGSLPPDARKVLASMVGGLLPSIEPLLKSVSGLPGVSEILKPVIDSLQGKLAALAKA